MVEKVLNVVFFVNGCRHGLGTGDVCENLCCAGALRFGVRRSSGAFERLMACVKLQRTGALQNAVAIFTILRPDTKPRFPNTAWNQRRWNVDMP